MTAAKLSDHRVQHWPTMPALGQHRQGKEGAQLQSSQATDSDNEALARHRCVGYQTTALANDDRHCTALRPQIQTSLCDQANDDRHCIALRPQIQTSLCDQATDSNALRCKFRLWGALSGHRLQLWSAIGPQIHLRRDRPTRSPVSRIRGAGQRHQNCIHGWAPSKRLGAW